MKLGIIGGAGLLGATTAFCAAQAGIADEIILTDVKRNVAVSHAMDIEQSVCEFTGTKLTVGEVDDLASCDVILTTVGLGEIKAPTRDVYLTGNLDILRGVAEKVRSWGTSPVFLTGSNPVDPINYKYFELTGLPRERFVGFSHNDTLRLIWAAAMETGIPSTELTALVLGEHGDYQVPLFSTLRRRGENDALKLTDAQRESILRRIKEWFGDYQKLDAKRSSGWSSGVGLSHMLKLIATDSDEIYPCSVIPDGEYGLKDLSIGLPVRLGRGGVREIIELELEDTERAGLDAAANKIKGLIQGS